MNDIPPPGPPAQPDMTGQTVVAPQGGGTSDSGKQKAVIGAVLAVVLIIGAFFVGMKIEKAKYDVGQPAYNEIYQAGQQSGTASGAKQGAAAGAAAGKQAGVAEGLEQGQKSGLEQGTAEGQKQGQKEGADAALGGFSDWSTTVPYVVEFGDGPNSEVPYVITTRTQMQPDVLYQICSSGENVCIAQPNGGGGGGGGGGSTGATGATP